MKKRRQASRERAGANGGVGKQEEIPVVEPLKPRLLLLIVFSVLFAVWVGALLVIYFATVYPKHHRTTTQDTTTASTIGS
jgi:hypothetical protein